MKAFSIQDIPNTAGFDRFVIRIDNGSPYLDNPPVVTTDEPLALVEKLLEFLREET